MGAFRALGVCHARDKQRRAWSYGLPVPPMPEENRVRLAPPPNFVRLFPRTPLPRPSRAHTSASHPTLSPFSPLVIVSSFVKISLPLPLLPPPSPPSAEVKRRDRRFAETQAQMTYNDFLNALMRLAEKLYSKADTDVAASAAADGECAPFGFETLTRPYNTHLEDPEVIGLFTHPDDALYSLYYFMRRPPMLRSMNTVSAKSRRRVNK